MKKITLLVLVLLSFILISCQSENNEEKPYHMSSVSLGRLEYYDLTSKVIVCITVNEPIWDIYYTNYGGAYEYEFYGSEIEIIYIWENSTLDIIFHTGERTVIKDYVSIHFDN